MRLERGYRIAESGSRARALKRAVAGTVFFGIVRFKAEFLCKGKLFGAYIDDADTGGSGAARPLCGDKTDGSRAPYDAEITELDAEAAYRGATDGARFAERRAGVAEIVGRDDESYYHHQP